MGYGNAMYENHETVIIKLSAEMHINFMDVSHLGPQSIPDLEGDNIPQIRRKTMGPMLENCNFC